MIKELLEKKEKKVEYIELIYDLIFVYIIGRNNTLLHHTQNGFVEAGMFMAYVVCTLAVIQIWTFTTYYINLYGRNSAREYIFPSPETGGPRDTSAVTRRLHRIQDRAGLPHIRFHDLRHTFATLTLEAGVDVKTVSQMLGHTDAGFTMNTYMHITDDMVRLRPLPVAEEGSKKNCLTVKICRRSKPKQILGTVGR